MVKILITGAEIDELRGCFIVIYQEQIVAKKENFYEALEIGLNEDQLKKFKSVTIYGAIQYQLSQDCYPEEFY